MHRHLLPRSGAVRTEKSWEKPWALEHHAVCILKWTARRCYQQFLRSGRLWFCPFFWLLTEAFVHTRGTGVTAQKRGIIKRAWCPSVSSLSISLSYITHTLAAEADALRPPESFAGFHLFLTSYLASASLL